MKHFISSDLLNQTVKEGKKAAKASFGNFEALRYKGFNIETDERNPDFARLVLLFDNNGNRQTYSIVI